MMYRNTILAAAGATMASAASNMSVCDTYTTALFKDNTGANQYKLISTVVNQAVLGNTTYNANFTGILGMGMYNGEQINLIVYFNGAQNSTNQGGDYGVSVNFLDGGGAAPIEKGMPADDTTSNQYTLLTHLYEYFGAVFGCSDYGMTGYPAYAGDASLYEVHKFMGLDENQVGYFNEQVGLSAASFGVSMADVTAAGMELNKIFNNRCGPNITVIPAQGPQMQSICVDPSCPIAANGSCSGYPTLPMPVNITMTNSSMSSSTMSGGMTMTSGSMTMTSGMSSTGTMPASQTTNAGSNLVAGGLVAAAALVFAL